MGQSQNKHDLELYQEHLADWNLELEILKRDKARLPGEEVKGHIAALLEFHSSVIDLTRQLGGDEALRAENADMKKQIEKLQEDLSRYRDRNEAMDEEHRDDLRKIQEQIATIEEQMNSRVKKVSLRVYGNVVVAANAWKKAKRSFGAKQYVKDI